MKKFAEWSKEVEALEKKCLVIIFHGMDSSPETISGLVEVVAKSISSHHIHIPKLPFKWNHRVNLRRLSEELLDYIDELLERGNYETVKIIGHSAGGVLAQAVYIISQNRDSLLGRFPPSKMRLILIAPMSKGWSINHHLPLIYKISWIMGMVSLWLLNVLKLAVFFRSREEPWIYQLKKGSVFLTWLRVSWLNLKKEKPEIIQMLGSIDEIISWRDMVDSATSGETLHIEVRFSDHVSIIDFESESQGQKRVELFKSVLVDSIGSIKESDGYVEPWDVLPTEPKSEVKRVVFVLHGIRDEGHWTQKIASKARSLYKDAGFKSRKEIAVVTSSYGFFSMFSFLIKWKRTEKMKWFVDEYIEARRLYPNAKFSFIGHSNGTYLLAEALRIYSDIKFERVAFAGSVVSSRFDWDRLHELGQVQFVRNYAATSDVVVAIFPKIADVLPLNWLLGNSLGGAGVTSFTENIIVDSRNYVIGGHGAAIEEENWLALANYAVSTEFDNFKVDESLYGPQSWWINSKLKRIIVSIGGWGLVLVIVGLLGLLAWGHPLILLFLPLVYILSVFPVIAYIQSRAAGKSVSRRIKIQEYCKLVMKVGLIVPAILTLLVVFEVLFIDPNYSDTVRTSSVFVYAICVYKILTKV